MTHEDACVTERVVRARVPHRCDAAWPPSTAITIKPGEFYVLVTEYPGGESGYADAAGHPVRMRICVGCANLRQSEMLRVADRPAES